VVSRQRKAAGSSKGNISKSNPVSNSEAQTPKQTSPIDYTKPLNVILPSSSSSSSSSESTLSDYSTDTQEILRKSAKDLNKIKKNNKKKTPLKKIPLKKAPQKTKNNPPKEVVTKDTSILDTLHPTCQVMHLPTQTWTHQITPSINL
jgi:hypothetical protein